MLSVCIYCGNSKTVALGECTSCSKSPQSHRDVIRSIVLSYSETEPYLNFLSLAEIEAIQQKIIDGSAIDIHPDVFKSAEEAYSAVSATKGPKLIQRFSDVSVPIITFILLAFLAAIFM